MFSRLKLLLTAAVALTALAAAIDSAQATTLFSIVPGGNISATNLGKLSFESALATLACEVTVRGSLSSGGLTVLVELLLMGAITEVSINTQPDSAENPRGCRNGTFIPPVLNLPWRIVWRALKEVNLTSTGQLLGRTTRAKIIQIREAQFKVVTGGVECLFQGNIEGIKDTIEQAGGEAHHTAFITGLIRANEAVTIAKHEGSVFCPSSARFRGSLGLEPKQTISKLIP
jgi:hypothetical protein